MRSPVAVCLFVAAMLPPAVGPIDPAVNALAERGHWKRARALAESRLKANPNDADALWLLSRVKMAWNDPDGALPPAEKAVAIDGKNVEYRWQLAQVVGEMASNANVFKQIGLARRFRREAEAALAIDPKHIPSMIGMMIYYHSAPGIVGGDKKKAQDMIGQIAAIDKAKGYIAEAELAEEANQPEKREAAFVNAAQADPSLYQPHAALMNIYAVRQRWDLVEKEALAARHIDPDRVGPYQNLAAVYATQEKWSELEATIAEAEKRIPDCYGPSLRAASALLATGKDLQRAERYARKYLTQEPEPNNASFAFAHWRLGLILEKLGRKAEAISELETASRLDKKFEPAQKDLKRLRGA